MEQYRIRAMEIEDYDKVFALWKSIEGFVIRPEEDSREGVERFLKHNPNISVVAVNQDTIDGKEEVIGAVLCGHDGRSGSMYHVCVAKGHRKQGVGKMMVDFCVKALSNEKIAKVHLIAFTRNDIGNSFWNGLGWSRRQDLNYYDHKLRL